MNSRLLQSLESGINKHCGYCKIKTKELECLRYYADLQPLWKKDHKIKTYFDVKKIKSIKSTSYKIQTTL